MIRRLMVHCRSKPDEQSLGLNEVFYLVSAGRNRQTTLTNMQQEYNLRVCIHILIQFIFISHDFRLFNYTYSYSIATLPTSLLQLFQVTSWSH